MRPNSSKLDDLMAELEATPHSGQAAGTLCPVVPAQLLRTRQARSRCRGGSRLRPVAVADLAYGGCRPEAYTIPDSPVQAAAGGSGRRHLHDAEVQDDPQRSASPIPLRRRQRACSSSPSSRGARRLMRIQACSRQALDRPAPLVASSGATASMRSRNFSTSCLATCLSWDRVRRCHGKWSCSLPNSVSDTLSDRG